MSVSISSTIEVKIIFFALHRALKSDIMKLAFQIQVHIWVLLAFCKETVPVEAAHNQSQRHSAYEIFSNITF